MYKIEDITDTFLHGDVLEHLRLIPDHSVDLIVTSPPYNLKNSTGNGLKNGKGGKWENAKLLSGYSHYDDNLPHDVYVKWQIECLTEMMRVLKDDGAIFYNHKWRVQGGLLQERHDIVGSFPVRQIIIWQRNGGFNFNKGYFVPTFEVVYMIAKKDFKLADKANRHGDIWTFSADKNNPHPAPFPVELAERIISSTNAKIVLDPFMGSGTTAVACQNFNRNFIGIELSDEYIEQSKTRLFNQQTKLF